MKPVAIRFTAIKFRSEKCDNMYPASFIIKGNLCWCESPQELRTLAQGYLVCVDGICQGAFPDLPEKYRGLPVLDAGNRLVIPGMTDLHVHASQYTYRGLGMDLELLDWLNSCAFPEEARYRDPDYAGKAYEIFCHDLLHSVTTRAVVFATMHPHTTVLLMELLEKTGLITMVGKVNMDRNSPDYLCEADPRTALADTRRWIEDTKDRFSFCSPILTPRFTPSCSDELMEGLGRLRREYGLPVQSHLSENLSEIREVKELCPWSEDYSDTYSRSGLLEGSVMAHCVWSPDSEAQRLKRENVYIAHCPASNTNLRSGIAPVRKYLSMGIKIGLGSDIAGGHQLSLLGTVAHAISASKLRWRLVDQTLAPLTLAEAFWMATAGGGSYFGKTGSFLPGYEFDAVILDDSAVKGAGTYSTADRLARYIFCGAHTPGELTGKYVRGRRVV